MKKGLILTVFLLLVFTVTGCGGGSAPGPSGEQKPPATSPVHLKIATLDVGSSWYNYGAAFAELIRKELPPGSVVDVLPYSGTLGNIDLVANGEADLGLTSAPVGKWAMDGTVAFVGKKKDNLRLLVGGLDQYWFAAIARKEVPFDSIKEIKEKKIPVRIVSQPPGSIGAYGTDAVLEAYGLTKKDIESYGGSVRNTSTEVFTADMKDGRADLLFQNTNKGHPAVTDISITTPIKFLSYEPEIIQKLQEKYGFSPAVIPAGTFKGQDEDIQTVGYPTILFASDKMSQEVAYAVTKALVNNAQVLRDNIGAMKVFTAERAVKETGGMPFHPGAEKFYREKGLIK